MRVYQLLRICEDRCGKPVNTEYYMIPYNRSLCEKAYPADRRIIAITEDGLDNPEAEPVIITDDNLVLFTNGQIWHLGGTASLNLFTNGQIWHLGGITSLNSSAASKTQKWCTGTSLTHHTVPGMNHRRSYKCYMIWQ